MLSFIHLLAAGQDNAEGIGSAVERYNKKRDCYFSTKLPHFLFIYRVCGLALTAGIAMKFGTAQGRSRLDVGSAKCIDSYGRKGVPPAPCNFGAS